MDRFWLTFSSFWNKSDQVSSSLSSFLSDQFFFKYIYSFSTSQIYISNIGTRYHLDSIWNYSTSGFNNNNHRDFSQNTDTFWCQWKQSSLPKSTSHDIAHIKLCNELFFRIKICYRVTINEGKVNSICTGPWFRCTLPYCCWSASTTNFRFKRSATCLFILQRKGWMKIFPFLYTWKVEHKLCIPNVSIKTPNTIFGFVVRNDVSVSIEKFLREKNFTVFTFFSS